MEGGGTLQESPRRPLLARRFGTSTALCLVALCLIIGTISLTAVNRTTDSDPMGTLATSSNLVLHQSPLLSDLPSEEIRILDYRVVTTSAGPVYAFPLGTAIALTPVLAILGVLEIPVPASDSQLQIYLAAGISVASVLLMYALARRFVGNWVAFGLSAVFWLGTPLSSTGATALWSHDLGVLLALGLLLVLTEVLTRDANQPGLAAIAGVISALLITTRPQMTLLVVCGTAVMFFYARRFALFWMLATALPLVLLSTYYWILTREWIPAYYLPSRLAGGDFWTALLANLVSPSRGVIVYVPLLVGIGLLAALKPSLVGIRRPLFILSITWLLLHLLAISRFHHWWGGWSFGPRFMTDVVPAMFLVTCLVWPSRSPKSNRRAIVGAFACLAALSIWINTVQGLYNPYTRFWYVEPNIDARPELIWDWEYPQFLASESGHESRSARDLKAIPEMRLGQEYSYTSHELALVGWSTGFVSPQSLMSFLTTPAPMWRDESSFRWSEGNAASIYFQLHGLNSKTAEGRLHLNVRSFSEQSLLVRINGHAVYEGELLNGDSDLLMSFDPTLLKSGRNEISLELPDAVVVNSGPDFRQIAIGLRSVQIV